MPRKSRRAELLPAQPAVEQAARAMIGTRTPELRHAAAAMPACELLDEQLRATPDLLALHGPNCQHPTCHEWAKGLWRLGRDATGQPEFGALSIDMVRRLVEEPSADPVRLPRRPRVRVADVELVDLEPDLAAWLPLRMMSEQVVTFTVDADATLDDWFAAARQAHGLTSLRRGRQPRQRGTLQAPARTLFWGLLEREGKSDREIADDWATRVERWASGEPPDEAAQDWTAWREWMEATAHVDPDDPEETRRVRYWDREDPAANVAWNLDRLGRLLRESGRPRRIRRVA